MSSHFTYEIDERKLRVKLQDLEIPYSSDAWQNFEAYAGSQAKHSGSSAIKDFQLPLNRNVIVPAIFGVMILFFSFLLFNFINIKNPDKAAGQNVEITIPSAEVKNDITPKIPVGASENTPAGNTNNEAIKEPETTLQENKVEPPRNLLPAGTPGLANKPLQQPVRQQASAAKQPTMAPSTQLAGVVPQPAAATPTIQQVPQNNAVPPAQAAVTPGLKKKQKRRNVDIADADSTSSARPSLSADEREPEARPN